MYSESDYENACREIGLPRYGGRVINYLSGQNEPVDSVNIERGTQLRQPEVSTTTTKLEKLGLITIDEFDAGIGPGRRRKSYIVSPDYKAVIKGMMIARLESIQGPVSEMFIFDEE